MRFVNEWRKNSGTIVWHSSTPTTSADLKCSMFSPTDAPRRVGTPNSNFPDHCIFNRLSDIDRRRKIKSALLSSSIVFGPFFPFQNRTVVRNFPPSQMAIDKGRERPAQIFCPIPRPVKTLVWSPRSRLSSKETSKHKHVGEQDGSTDLTLLLLYYIQSVQCYLVVEGRIEL